MEFSFSLSTLLSEKSQRFSIIVDKATLIRRYIDNQVSLFMILKKAKIVLDPFV